MGSKKQGASLLSRILVARKRILACALLFLLGASVVRTALLFSNDDLVATEAALRNEENAVPTQSESGQGTRRRTRRSRQSGTGSRAGRSRSKRGQRSSSRGSVESDGAQIGSVARHLRARKVKTNDFQQRGHEEAGRYGYPTEEPAPVKKDETGAYVWLDSGIEEAASSAASDYSGVFAKELDTLIEDKISDLFIDIKDGGDYDDSGDDFYDGFSDGFGVVAEEENPATDGRSREEPSVEAAEQNEEFDDLAEADEFLSALSEDPAEETLLDSEHNSGEEEAEHSDEPEPEMVPKEASDLLKANIMQVGQH